MKKLLFILMTPFLFNFVGTVKAEEENPSKIIESSRDGALFLLYHLGQSFPAIYQNRLQRHCVEAAFNGTELPRECYSTNSEGNERGLVATLTFDKVTCRSHASMMSARRCYRGENEQNAVRGARARNLAAALDLVGASGEGATGKYFTYIWDIQFDLNFANWQNGGSAIQMTAKTLAD